MQNFAYTTPPAKHGRAYGALDAGAHFPPLQLSTSFLHVGTLFKLKVPPSLVELGQKLDLT